MSKEPTAEKINRLTQQYKMLCRDNHFLEAISPLKKLCELERNVSGRFSVNYARILNDLATLYYFIDEYEAAEPLFREALEIDSETVGEMHPNYAITLDNLAGLYRATGNYQAAEPLLRQLLDIYQQTIGEHNSSFATTLTDLAGLYRELGDYRAAKPLYLQALDFWKTHYEESPYGIVCLNGLAGLYRDIGDYQAAESLYRQALDILRATGETNINYAVLLNNLAVIYRETSNYQAAEPRLRQALEIYRQTVGEKHSYYATGLHTLAELYRATGNYQAAESRLRDALNIKRETVGKKHPDYAATLNGLAMVYHDMGNYQAAESLYAQALNIRCETLGDKHPRYAESLNNLATLYAASDRVVDAYKLASRAAVIYDHIIAQIFSVGSESQRTAYLERILGSEYVYLSLVSQCCPVSDSALRSAMGLVLRRKAIGAEALAAQRDAVLSTKYPAAREKLNKMRKLTGKIARTMLAGPSSEGIETHNQRLNTWNTELEHLEMELASQIPEINLKRCLRDADYEAVANKLPDGAVLIEFVYFSIFDFAAVPAFGESRWKPPHYLAFVLHAGDPNGLKMVDLGDAEAIDRLIAEFRAQITGEDEKRTITFDIYKAETVVVNAGFDLRSVIFDPLIPHLNGATRLFLAADGELTRLPFEALPHSSGKHLIDNYAFSYLSVGRDVLRFGLRTSHDSNDPVVIADPDFDFADSSNFERVASPQSRDLARTLQKVHRLPGTAVEGERIARMLNVTCWLEKKALERPFKALHSPQVIHLATHGFFLKDQMRDPASRQLSFADRMLDRISTAGIENPLLRSGLVLAGVNTWLNGQTPPRDAEDGVLTALDVSGMDLTDTELVVLSACDTGLGDIQTGEGVFGLRRAVILAGAKTLIMSLWKVPDEQTKELMIDFYKRILQGEPRAEALRNAQLELKKKYPHPYFWGAFICQGDPGPLTAIG